MLLKTPTLITASPPAWFVDHKREGRNQISKCVLQGNREEEREKEAAIVCRTFAWKMRNNRSLTKIYPKKKQEKVLSTRLTTAKLSGLSPDTDCFLGIAFECVWVLRELECLLLTLKQRTHCPGGAGSEVGMEGKSFFHCHPVAWQRDIVARETHGASELTWAAMRTIFPSTYAKSLLKLNFKHLTEWRWERATSRQSGRRPARSPPRCLRHHFRSKFFRNG